MNLRRLLSSLVMAASLLAKPGSVIILAQTAAEPTLKAAYLYNFAKFTEWQSLDPAASLTLCVIGDTSIAKALVQTVRGQNIAGHAVRVTAITGDVPVRTCHVLFISKSTSKPSMATIGTLRTLPILTVSDGKDFAQSTGIVELFIDDDGRLRFAINTDAAARSGLHLSSRLLGLAQIVRDANAP